MCMCARACVNTRARSCVRSAGGGLSETINKRRGEGGTPVVTNRSRRRGGAPIRFSLLHHFYCPLIIRSPSDSRYQPPSLLPLPLSNSPSLTHSLTPCTFVSPSRSLTSNTDTHAHSPDPVNPGQPPKTMSRPPADVSEWYDRGDGTVPVIYNI